MPKQPNTSIHFHKYNWNVKLTFKAVAAFFHSGVSLWQWPHLFRKTNKNNTKNQLVNVIQIWKLFHSHLQQTIGDWRFIHQQEKSLCQKIIPSLRHLKKNLHIIQTAGTVEEAQQDFPYNSQFRQNQAVAIKGHFLQTADLQMAISQTICTRMEYIHITRI